MAASARAIASGSAQRGQIGGKHLEIDAAAPGIDCGHNGPCLDVVLYVSGKRLESCDPDDRLGKRQAKPTRKSKADPRAGKGPRPGRNGKAPERRETDSGVPHDIANHRRQPFGMSCVHHFEAARQQRTGRGIEEGDRTGRKRGVQAKDDHRPCAGEAAAASRFGQCQTGRTSVTSGMKCRKRFSMPCFSVAVELGQPEHEPFMLRNTTPSR